MKTRHASFIVGLCIAASVLCFAGAVLVSGCKSNHPPRTDYPWKGPLTDETGSNAVPPRW